MSRPRGSLLRPVTTRDVVVRSYVLPIAGLPVPRLRVAHLSDLHVGRGLPPDHYASACALVASYAPDLVVLTGDLVAYEGNGADLRAVLDALPRTTHGTFAVLGNHDHWAAPAEVRAVLGGAGVVQLNQGCATLALDAGRPVVVCGDERPWGPGPGAFPAHAVAIVLSHTPDNVYDLARRGAAVVFAGHLHGGHLRLPGIGALVAPSRQGRRFMRGHFRVGETHLFVSTGLGGLPLRLYCEPDVLVVDLVAAE